MKKEACMFCGAPATLLCDGRLGYSPKVLDEQEIIDPLHPYTCDAPMCRSCTVQLAKMHICSRGKGCRIETVDYCPICIRDLPAYPQTVKRLIYSPGQAVTIRRAHWAGFSNEYQNGLKLQQGGGQQCLDL